MINNSASIKMLIQAQEVVRNQKYTTASDACSSVTQQKKSFERNVRKKKL
jgi:hypothetical protein